ncbi:hypothetical protein CHO01_32610 [Cellulomonas hominis]|uniref:Uncharacterized protein n=1 Tax=Cellulomonas hominis TaxID=156981 RepID=A0A511FFX3_9CELL|nr:hypothetical protein CHO01_32610 [Cellulomonas hominis]
MTAGSCWRVIWYACQTWWYHRVFFTFAGFAGALAAADLSRAMTQESTGARTPATRPGGPRPQGPPSLAVARRAG